MAVFEVYRTARTAKDCDNYPQCSRGIRPGERYLLATASPWDMEVNQSERWLTLTVCREHMRPEPGPAP